MLMFMCVVYVYSEYKHFYIMYYYGSLFRAALFVQGIILINPLQNEGQKSDQVCRARMPVLEAWQSKKKNILILALLSA